MELDVRIAVRLERGTLEEIDALRPTMQRPDGRDATRSDVVRALVAEALRGRARKGTQP